MTDNIKVFCHSSIKITGSKIIYIDPFRINEDFKDADYVFSTHPHNDHFSEDDIERVINSNSIIITPDSSRELAYHLTKNRDKVLIIEPEKKYDLNGLSFTTTRAYNKEKMYHPKREGWVGYVIEMDRMKYYIAGDTDNIEEIRNIECDVAFLPIDGIYTMGYEEAAELANVLPAKVIVPIHYGEIVGEKEDAKKFAELVKNKEVKIMIE